MIYGIKYLSNEFEIDPVNLGKACKSYLFFFSLLISYEYFLFIKSVIFASNFIENSRDFIKIATFVLPDVRYNICVIWILVIEQNS